MDLRQKRNDILRIAEQYGARNLRVFGSVARGDDCAHSDVDLLVDMDPGRSLLDIVGLGQDLEELLDRRVDVLTDAVCTQRCVTASWPSRDRCKGRARLPRSHPRRNNDIGRMHIGEPRQPAINDARLRVEPQPRFT
jgi:predicted nucleotidyltransferase